MCARLSVCVCVHVLVVARHDYPGRGMLCYCGNVAFLRFCTEPFTGIHLVWFSLGVSINQCQESIRVESPLGQFLSKNLGQGAPCVCCHDPQWQLVRIEQGISGKRDNMGMLPVWESNPAYNLVTAYLPRDP
eukprot:scaffold293089_cov22-Tisochrysis_lutea.AAC.2